VVALFKSYPACTSKWLCDGL